MLVLVLSIVAFLGLLAVLVFSTRPSRYQSLPFRWPDVPPPTRQSDIEDPERLVVIPLDVAHALYQSHGAAYVANWDAPWFDIDEWERIADEVVAAIDEAELAA